jgi:hypothetical protein
MSLNAKKPASAMRRRADSGFCDWLLTQARQLRRHARHVMMVVMTMMDGELHLYATYLLGLDAVNPVRLAGERQSK